MNSIFNLHIGEDDKEKTLENVKNNISFTGSNLWILACAIIVASVGLNVNSTAVIIGAMLISPLMGPIVASGFALGIFDFDLLKKSLKNLLVATFAGLIVSSIYFFISPFKEVQSEILSRTSPNIYDILIAFFGGLVGVIAVTRVEKGNQIPGVAIATALMPPLCTAGYGIATGNIRFFLGAFFLYTINCVFICIATYVIVKFLNYPAKEDTDLKHQKQVKYGITTIILFMVLPSIYFAYNLFNQQQYKQAVNHFIEQEFTSKGNAIVYKMTDINKSPRTIELAFLTKRYSPKEMEELNKKLVSYKITNTKLIIRQDSSDNIASLKNNILNEMKGGLVIDEEKDKKIQMLEAQININTFDNKQLWREANSLFPEIKSVSIANHSIYFENDSMLNTAVMLYQRGKELNKEDKIKLKNWMMQRLSLQNLEIYDTDQLK